MAGTVARFDNIFNLRDLGGHPTTNGLTRRGLFFRADGIHRASPADVDKIGKLGVGTVIDLRSAAEIDRYGRFPIEELGGRFEHRPLLDRLWTHEMLERTPEPVEFLIERYRELVEDRPEQLAAIFETLAAQSQRHGANPDAPGNGVLFHCSAGKDRTGVTAALILGAVDASDSAIAEDYANTSHNMPALIDWIVANSKRGLDTMADQPKEFLECPPAAILGLLDHVREQHLSITGFLTGIGVPTSALDALQHGFVEPSAADGGER